MRAFRVIKYIDPEIFSLDGLNILVTHPQSGKTRSVSFEVTRLRKGDTLIYASSTHLENLSFIRHLIDRLREYNWDLRLLIVWYMGINKFCPRYPEIKKMRAELGSNFKQTEFCRKHCPLWNMKRIPKKYFEPGKPAIALRKKQMNKHGSSITHERIRIVTTEYGVKLLKRFYKEYASPDVFHHMMVLRGQEEEEVKEWGEPLYRRGCIRSFMMKKSIEVIERDDMGRIKRTRRRSIFGYPTVIVIPHELLPLMLKFASAYSARVHVVIDEFDRLLQKKLKRYIFERFEKVDKAGQLELYWDLQTAKQRVECGAVRKIFGEDTDALVSYYGKESTFCTMIPEIITLEKIVLPDGKRRAKELPLASLVLRSLKKHREKINGLTVVGSSIPMLPAYLIYRILQELRQIMPDEEFSIFYSFVEMPDRMMVVQNPFFFLGKPGVVYVRGSIPLSIQSVAQILKNNTNTGWNTVSLPYCVSAYPGFEKNFYPREWDCKNDVCVNKKLRIARIFRWHVNGTCIHGYEYRDIRIGKDYIKLGNTSLVTWLGGRMTRGYQFPDWVKYVVIDTVGGVGEHTVDETSNISMYRLGDLIQILFRINSRPEAQVVVTPKSLPYLKFAVEMFNLHVWLILKYSELVEQGVEPSDECSDIAMEYTRRKDEEQKIKRDLYMIKALKQLIELGKHEMALNTVKRIKKLKEKVKEIEVERAGKVEIEVPRAGEYIILISDKRVEIKTPERRDRKYVLIVEVPAETGTKITVYRILEPNAR